MSSVKEIKVNTGLSIQGTKGTMSSKVSIYENLPLTIFLNLTTLKREEFYVNCNSGDLIISSDSNSEIYFDVNKNGELVVIFPDIYDLSINSSGDLIISS